MTVDKSHQNFAHSCAGCELDLHGTGWKNLEGFNQPFRSISDLYFLSWPLFQLNACPFRKDVLMVVYGETPRQRQCNPSREHLLARDHFLGTRCYIMMFNHRARDLVHPLWERPALIWTHILLHFWWPLTRDFSVYVMVQWSWHLYVFTGLPGKRSIRNNPYFCMMNSGVWSTALNNDSESQLKNKYS